MLKKRKKLLFYLIILFCGTAALSLVLFFFAFNSYKQGCKEVISNMENTASTEESYMSHVISQNSSVFNILDRTLERILEQGKGHEIIEKYLTSETDYNKGDDDFICFYGLFDGQFIDGSGWVPDDEFDPYTRPWYIAVTNVPKGVIASSSYIDRRNGEKVITISKVLNDGKSVLCMDSYLEEMNTVSNPSANKAISYTFIVDSYGNVLNSSDQSYLGANFFSMEYLNSEENDLLQHVFSKQNKTLQCKYKGKDSYVFSRNMKYGMTYIIVADKKMLFKRENDIRMVYFILIIVILLAFVAYLVVIRLFLARTEKANEVRNVFLDNMSHRLITPVSDILGNIERILEMEISEQSKIHAKSIMESATSLRRIINEMIDYSLIRAKKLDIVTTDYQITDMINDISKQYVSEIKKKKLTFQMAIDSKLPSVLNGDVERIKQVISYLLDNSLKYTNKGGISLNLGYWKVVDGRLILHIEVHDTGMGIMPNDIDKIFKPYVQLTESDQEKRGAGLGLTVTNELVLLMDGRMWLDSGFGYGSQFYVEIPQKIVKHVPFSSTRLEGRRVMLSSSVIAPEAHVLVVDDVEMNLKVFSRLLRKTQIQIDTATSGEAGLELAKKNKYDIIFLDHMMPGMDGVDTFHAIRACKDAASKNAPIIVVTANVMTNNREEYQKIGFNDYLSKPVDFEKLEVMLRDYLPEELLLKEAPEPEEATV